MLEKSQGLVVKHRQTLIRCKKIIKHLKERCMQAGIDIGGGGKGGGGPEDVGTCEITGIESISMEASPTATTGSHKGSPEAQSELSEY